MLQNLETNNLENLQSKDLLHVASFLLEKFKQAKAVYPSEFIVRNDRATENNTIVEFCVAVVASNRDNDFYICSYMRANNFNCINGINIKKCNEADFLDEVKFIKRFNERQVFTG